MNTNNHHFLKYLNSSGVMNCHKLIRQYEDLLKNILIPTQKGAQAVIKIKESLVKMGFGYDFDYFLANDVLTERKGNCLGLPMLIASMLNDMGFKAGLRVIVSPHDLVYEEESDYLEELEYSMDYSNPPLAKKAEDMRWYRFSPMEHLVIEIDGDLVDTTPGEVHTVPDYESGRSMSFDEALGCIYQDRASLSMLKEDFEETDSLLKKGAQLYDNNREIAAKIAELRQEYFDDHGFTHAKEKYREIGGNDSLYFYTRYLHDREFSDIDKALGKYPAFAKAFSRKAKIMVQDDPKEAKFLFALASQLCARSAVLILPKFYMENAKELGFLFGNETIADILMSFKNNENVWGTFDFHNALYLLTGKRNHFFEAKECLKTPRQKTKLIYFQISNGVDAADETNAMERMYGSSFLFRRLVNTIK